EQGTAVFIRQRSSKGLLASMWELPHITVAAEEEVKFHSELFAEDEALITPLLKNVYETHQLLARPKGWFSDMEHIFSHIHWKIRVYESDLGVEEQKTADATNTQLLNVAEASHIYDTNGIFIT